MKNQKKELMKKNQRKKLNKKINGKNHWKIKENQSRRKSIKNQ